MPKPTPWIKQVVERRSLNFLVYLVGILKNIDLTTRVGTLPINAITSTAAFFPVAQGVICTCALKSNYQLQLVVHTVSRIIIQEYVAVAEGCNEVLTISRLFSGIFILTLLTICASTRLWRVESSWPKQKHTRAVSIVRATVCLVVRSQRSDIGTRRKFSLNWLEGFCPALDTSYQIK